MGKATRFLPVVGLALAAAGCGRETGIVLEVSLSSELDTALAAEGNNFELLRIWVGHRTEDPSFFRASDEAFFTTGRDRAAMATPFRYLLEPTGGLGDIGPLVFAAAVGSEPDDARLPFQIAGFDVADTPMSFVDDEVRVVSLVLVAPDGVEGGIDDGCIVWDMETGAPSRIAPDDDLDCDGAIGNDDCDDLDPHQNNLDRDGDGVTSCDLDCMDDPRSDLPWVDPATVHPGAPDPGENDPLACDHIDEDCDGNCQAPGRDADGSGATACGGVETGGDVVCEFAPADCNEQIAGNQPGTDVAGEACNARDDGCDGFLPPRLPCVFDDGSACHWGQVGCDEYEGEYEGENGTLHCKPLPDGFSDGTAPPGVCDASVPASCLESPDPIGCGFTGLATPRASCQVSATAMCRHDRTMLLFPGAPTPLSCAWHIVGGIHQAEWEIGFVDVNAPPDAVPQPTSAQCGTELAVRSMVPRPAQRSVLVLIMSPQDPTFGVRPMVVQLDAAAAGEECTGALNCLFDAQN